MWLKTSRLLYLASDNGEKSESFVLKCRPPFARPVD